ncbi:hypothetical protein LWI29_008551 [Acer saccharum]|uniref:CCHC-type domain-containing protein n=1 Tax=Acer saccharum TaxID=4024 RepID=A0AA39S340_ACESA|nr:hypothetical protein LWI29_008551 [Acer saccharum]
MSKRIGASVRQMPEKELETDGGGGASSSSLSAALSGESVPSICRYGLHQRFAKKPFVDFCGDCYKTTSWVEAYSRNIFPVGHPSEWNIPEDVRSRVVYPPAFRAQAGRPKKKRYKSAGEYRNGKTRNYTICGKSGHNRQNCRNAQPCQIPVPSAHRSNHVDRTGAGNVEKKATIHKNVH